MAQTSNIIAWHGVVKMHEARWTDKDGSTITFRLPMDPASEQKRNPFQSFTRRRKGMAGTRFYMTCHLVRTNGHDSSLVYNDEVMLAGWNDSQTTGHTVKFWLCADVLGHPFEGFSRKVDEFAVSLVELDEDNEPVDQKMRDRMERGHKAVTSRVSYVAAMLCKNPRFWEWVNDHSDWTWEKWGSRVTDEITARQLLCDVLQIKSRAELDAREAKAEEFHERFRKPFVEWDTGSDPF